MEFRSAAAEQIEEEEEKAKCASSDAADSLNHRAQLSVFLRVSRFLLRGDNYSVSQAAFLAVSAAPGSGGRAPSKHGYLSEPHDIQRSTLLNQKTHRPRVANAFPPLLPVENTAANLPPCSPPLLLLLPSRSYGGGGGGREGGVTESKPGTSSTGCKKSERNKHSSILTFSFLFV